jgi:hypothetical protein
MMRAKLRKPRKSASSFSKRESAEVLESAEEPLDFVALLVEGAVVLPWLDAV